MRLVTILKCLLPFVAFAAIVASCGGTKSDGCTKGASIACTCTTGRTGAQICQADGSLGACICTDASGGGAANGGGANGGGAANGGGVSTGGGGATGGGFVPDAGPVDAGPSPLGQLCTNSCPDDAGCISVSQAPTKFCSPTCNTASDTCNTNFAGPGVGVCALLAGGGMGSANHCAVLCGGMAGTDGGCPTGLTCTVLSGNTAVCQ